MRQDLRHGVAFEGGSSLGQGFILFQHDGQHGTGACDAALHGAHRSLADGGGVRIGKAAHHDQDQGFAILDRQTEQRASDIGELARPTLLFQRPGDLLRRLGVPRHLPPCTAMVRQDLIAQNHEQPRFEMGARLVRAPRPPRLDQRLLGHVLRQIAVPAQREREGAKMRNQGNQACPEWRVAIGVAASGGGF